MAERRHRPGAAARPAATVSLATTAAGLLLALGATAAELPGAFGAFTLGMSWEDASAVGTHTELTHATSDWERHVHACGYRSARFEIDGTTVVVTTQDFQVTELSQTTAIRPGRSVQQVAQEVINAYGKPTQATLRDDLGAVTVDTARASHALIEYAGSNRVSIAISAEPLWQYRVNLVAGEARRLENRTIRCAREREKEAG